MIALELVSIQYYLERFSISSIPIAFPCMVSVPSQEEFRGEVQACFLVSPAGN